MSYPITNIPYCQSNIWHPTTKLTIVDKNKNEVAIFYGNGSVQFNVSPIMVALEILKCIMTHYSDTILQCGNISISLQEIKYDPFLGCEIPKEIIELQKAYNKIKYLKNFY